MDNVRAKLNVIAGDAGVHTGRRRFGAAGRAAVRFALLSATLGAACDADARAQMAAATADAARARADSANRSRPGYVIDSILPPAIELERFRTAVGGLPVTALGGGAASRDALVRGAFAALLRGDTAALSAMTLSAREFADLVYPESRYARVPYRQAPALMWMMMQGPSGTGRTRAVARIAGLDLRLIGHSCTRPPEREGGSIVWNGCTVQIADRTGRVESHQLFGAVIERAGRFKVVSWAGEF